MLLPPAQRSAVRTKARWLRIVAMSRETLRNAARWFRYSVLGAIAPDDAVLDLHFIGNIP
jgi:hypothetical protein